MATLVVSVPLSSIRLSSSSKSVTGLRSSLLSSLTPNMFHTMLLGRPTRETSDTMMVGKVAKAMTGQMAGAGHLSGESSAVRGGRAAVPPIAKPAAAAVPKERCLVSGGSRPAAEPPDSGRPPGAAAGGSSPAAAPPGGATVAVLQRTCRRYCFRKRGKSVAVMVLEARAGMAPSVSSTHSSKPGRGSTPDSACWVNSMGAAPGSGTPSAPSSGPQSIL
mmetsp:Transcript_10218/g.21881  ORF Transcript_10218/g.21881 Transcript_10218/m.21881 type:complete len:219 (-) Transcript_10218:1294-1950(-)